MTARRSAPGARSARTRAEILRAAEEIFSRRGFAATRLEDVAKRVGIRRASIVYYFKNKRALYEAVLQDVFSGLEERIEAALSAPEPLPRRIEACVSAWVEYVGSRPSFARLLLREVADGGDDRRAPIRRYTRPYFELIRKHVIERRDPTARPFRDVDPVHMASTIAGGSVFFAAAIPALVPEIDLDPTSPEQIAAQREQALRILPLLLDVSKKRPASPKGAQRAEGERSSRKAVRRSPSTPAAKRSPRR